MEPVAQKAVLMDAAYPSLLLIRRATLAARTQSRLILAHSLVGDHRGYTGLWRGSLQGSEVYALRHRSLDGARRWEGEARWRWHR